MLPRNDRCNGRMSAVKDIETAFAMAGAGLRRIWMGKIVQTEALPQQNAHGPIAGATIAALGYCRPPPLSLG